VTPGFFEVKLDVDFALGLVVDDAMFRDFRSRAPELLPFKL